MKQPPHPPLATNQRISAISPTEAMATMVDIIMGIIMALRCGPTRASLPKDYFVIFRERFWLFLFCFSIIYWCPLVYPKETQTLQERLANKPLRVNPTPIDTGLEKTAEDMLGHEEFQSLVDILESPTLTNMVDKASGP